MTSFPGRGAPAPPLPAIEPTDARALRAAGGTLLDSGDGVVVGGWRISSRATPILGKAQLDALESRLGSAHLPEMVYGSALELTHEATGVRLHFNAEDALREWLEEDLPPLKVAAAAAWARGHAERFGSAAMPPPAPRAPSSSSSSSAAAAATITPTASWDHTETQIAYDWTFTTPYRGSVDAPSSSVDWSETSSRIDRGLLTARDPILFFDELTLYESELDDNGESSVTVKVRVMPKCWFVLLRFWMRCDGVAIRLRETRLFHAIGSGEVVRETSRREETFEGLRARGAPSEPGQYPDANEAASVLLAAGGPVDVAYHSLKL